MEKAEAAQVAVVAIFRTENKADFKTKYAAAEAAMMALDARMADPAAKAAGDSDTQEARAAYVERTQRLFTGMMMAARKYGEKFPDAAPAAGGKRRKMSRKYCKKTTCKKMGFSQKASCRPYKNCFTRRRSKSSKGY
jgi:hypothetical protein